MLIRNVLDGAELPKEWVTIINSFELVSPAGNFEKLKTAFKFGADAVYLGGKNFSLRAAANNFSIDQMIEATSYAHNLGKQVYVTVNSFIHEDELAELKTYINELKNIPLDGAIVSDLGVLSMFSEYAPDIPIHISTQANTVNSRAIEFYEKLGATQVVLGRELSFEDIKKIREHTSLKLEVFVHGAMCMSYSGRCLISNFMTGRNANAGACAHPCRYSYALMEETRPGEIYPVEEDSKGTYILSSRDLCVIEHIHKFLEIGVDAFKIEGRMKGIHYQAIVARAYRKAIDAYLKDPGNYKYDPNWGKPLTEISHRPYTPGFYFEENRNKLQAATSESYTQTSLLVGVVQEKLEDNKYRVEMRNKLLAGQPLIAITPSSDIPLPGIAEFITAKNGKSHALGNPNQIMDVQMDADLSEGCLLVIDK